MYDPHYKLSDNLTDAQRRQIAEHERKRNMRKVFVNVTVKIALNMDEGVVTEVLENMDYNFKSQSEGVDVVETEIINWDVTDSK